MLSRFVVYAGCAVAVAPWFAIGASQQSPGAAAGGFRPAAPVQTEKAEQTDRYEVAGGTRILLNMINSVSTKQAAVGDRVYLETAFPVLAGGRIVIPQGSWVTGTITQLKRPGRVKGRGELFVRFDTLTLPNGVTRSFNNRIGSLDGRAAEQLDRSEGKLKSPGNKAGDAGTVATTTAAGAGIGSVVGSASGNWAKGAGIGAGAGAAAGLIGVLASRGPDATLSKGTTMEMVLDRALTFDAKELDFSGAPPRPPLSDGGSGPVQPPAKQQKRGWSPFPL